MQGRKIRGLWVTSRRPPQPWVLLGEVDKTSTPVGKAALALAAVKVEGSPPHACPVRLNFESDDDGRAHGQKRPR